jgi:hypothetical protein
MRTEKHTINFYKYTLDAIKFINSSNLDYIDKLCKINNILSTSTAKVNKTILIVDEYGILDN